MQTGPQQVEARGSSCRPREPELIALYSRRDDASGLARLMTVPIPVVPAPACSSAAALNSVGWSTRPALPKSGAQTPTSPSTPAESTDVCSSKTSVLHWREGLCSQGSEVLLPWRDVESPIRMLKMEANHGRPDRTGWHRRC